MSRAACHSSCSLVWGHKDPDLRFPVADWPADSSCNGVVLRCPQKGRLAALHDEPSKARTPATPFPSLVGTL